MHHRSGVWTMVGHEEPEAAVTMGAEHPARARHAGCGKCHSGAGGATVIERAYGPLILPAGAVDKLSDGLPLCGPARSPRPREFQIPGSTLGRGRWAAPACRLPAWLVDTTRAALVRERVLHDDTHVAMLDLGLNTTHRGHSVPRASHSSLTSRTRHCSGRLAIQLAETPREPELAELPGERSWRGALVCDEH